MSRVVVCHYCHGFLYPSDDVRVRKSAAELRKTGSKGSRLTYWHYDCLLHKLANDLCNRLPKEIKYGRGSDLVMKRAQDAAREAIRDFYVRYNIKKSDNAH